MRRAAFVVAVAVALAVCGSGAALAATKVGVVDIGTVMEESRAGRQANVVLNELIQQLRTQLEPYEENVDELVRALEDASLTDDSRADLEAQLAMARGEYGSVVELFEADVEEALFQLRRQVLNDIGIVLQRIAEAQGFDLIVDAEAVLYYRRVVDLTFEVIRDYDELWQASRSQSGN